MTELYESKNKAVSHPKHYALIPEKNVEVIDVIEAATSDLMGIEATDTGNAIKYILRWNKKNGKEDIEKAIYYLTHLLRHLEQKEQNTVIDPPGLNAIYSADCQR